MSSKSLFWFIFPYTIIITALATGIVFYYSSDNQKKLFYKKTESQLEINARVLQDTILEDLLAKRYRKVQTRTEHLGQITKTRLTVILPDGVVIADSDQPVTGLENHRTRPEFASALSGDLGVSVRYSYSLEKNLMYVALPVYGEKGELVAAIRSSRGADMLARELSVVWERNLWVFLVVLLTATLVVWMRTRQLIRPLQDLKRHIDRLALGELKGRIKNKDNLPTEVVEMVKSLDRMAQEFDNSLNWASQKGIEQDTILANMNEGVIVVDKHERITHINRTAASILDLEEQAALGKKVYELIRLPVLQSFVRKTLTQSRRREREITLNPKSSNEKIFVVQSSPLWLKEEMIGAIFVFLDITVLRRLEKHRQEFVSNVSHELKTPLTTIKGFAETMQNPSLESMEDVKKFSGIIEKHANRLDALIDDLLKLSKIERQGQAGDIEMKQQAVDEIVDSAIEICQLKAESKKVKLILEENTKCSIEANRHLMEQALINLLDNAIKYSPEGSKVNIRAKDLQDRVEISIRDHGSGIPQESLKRLFERFYRIDKGRSRDMGGTGLGLAIVKHIVNVHRGDIRVESEMGQGSVFIVTIPRFSNHNLTEIE